MICSACDTDLDDHDHEHLAHYCLPAKLQAVNGRNLMADRLAAAEARVTDKLTPEERAQQVEICGYDMDDPMIRANVKNIASAIREAELATVLGVASRFADSLQALASQGGLPKKWRAMLMTQANWFRAIAEKTSDG